MPTQCKAILLSGLHQPFTLQDVTMSDPQEGEVLVRMKASGICHSDVSVQNGVLQCTKFPCILGHEGSGEVVQLGPKVQELQTGDKVLLSFDYCGECRQCQTPGSTAATCQQWYPKNFFFARPDGTTSSAYNEAHSSIGGKFFGQSSFSEYSVVSVRSCVKVPADTDLTLLASLGCGVQTGAGTVLNVLKPEKEQSLAIWGLGGVGMSALFAAKHLGVRLLIAVDVIPSRLELAKSFGATHTINAKEEDVVAAISKITNGEGLNFAIEASGVPACISAAYDSLGLHGIHAQVGAPPAGMHPPLNLVAAQVLQKSFIGVLEGNSHPPDFIPQLVQMHKDGHLPLEKISKVYALEDYQLAINAMHDGSVIKPIISYG